MRIDRTTRILMRNNKAVALSINEFVVFDAIWKAGTLTMPTLLDKLYDGVKEPPEYANGCLNVISCHLRRKLKYVGLEMRVTNRKQHSFYRIVPT